MRADHEISWSASAFALLHVRWQCQAHLCFCTRTWVQGVVSNGTVCPSRGQPSHCAIGVASTLSCTQIPWSQDIPRFCCLLRGWTAAIDFRRGTESVCGLAVRCGGRHGCFVLARFSPRHATCGWVHSRIRRIVCIILVTPSVARITWTQGE